jgi:hypothetical protein
MLLMDEPLGEIFSVDLPRLHDRLHLAHDPHYHELRSQVLEFLFSRQMRPEEGSLTLHGTRQKPLEAISWRGLRAMH